MRGGKKLVSWLLVLALAVALVPQRGRAVLSGVYLTAVNEKVMDLDAETMPFWSKGVLYVSNRMFEGTYLGVNYVRNNAMNLAVLYTPRIDLRFDLENGTAFDKQGNYYAGQAIVRGDVVFFPLEMVCKYFNLNWSYSETDTVPLIRITDSSATLPVADFIDAAGSTMLERYNAYEKLVLEQQAQTGPQEPPIHVAAGQRVYLLVESTAPEATRSVMEKLGTDQQATFLLTAEQMADGDLLRGLVAGGHGVALLLQGTTEQAVEEEIQQGRALLWQAACAWLDLVCWRGEADMDDLFASLGCRTVTAKVEESGGLEADWMAVNLLRAISYYREDLGVFLGSDSGCLPGLDALLDGLRAAQYSVAAWRLTA